MSSSSNGNKNERLLLVNDKNTKIKIVIDNLYDDDEDGGGGGGLKMDDDIMMDENKLFEETMTNENCSLNDVDRAPTPMNQFNGFSHNHLNDSVDVCKNNIDKNNDNKLVNGKKEFFPFNWGSLMSTLGADSNGKLNKISNRKRFGGSTEISSQKPIAYL